MLQDLRRPHSWREPLPTIIHTVHRHDPARDRRGRHPEHGLSEQFFHADTADGGVRMSIEMS
jgi:hypothetical protein